MINSVGSANAANYAGRAAFRGDVQNSDPFARKGECAMPDADKPKKSGKAGKVILGIVGGALAIGTVLVLGARRNWFKALETLEGAKFFDKVGHYLNKAGSWLNENVVLKVANLIEKAPEAAE